MVQLSPDHPGFKDPVYRQRRNQIARLALDYREPEPVTDVDYTQAEHAVWRTVWEHLTPLHDAHASEVYRAASQVLVLPRDRIPQLAEVNQLLSRAGGFQMLPAAGLVSERTFLSYLGRRVFLSTQYMRHQSTPLYTPEPDVVHELVGHAATLAHPGFTRLNQLFGETSERVSDAQVARLARVYWYTLEFGVVRESRGVRAYGAGLLSSFGELGRFESHAKLQPFDIERMASTPYDPTNYQAMLFVAPSFNDMVAEVSQWLAAQ